MKVAPADKPQRPLPRVIKPAAEMAKEDNLSEEIRLLGEQVRNNRSAPEEERRRMIGDVFKTAIEIAKKGDKTESLMAYKELKSIKDEIALLTFQSAEDQSKFMATFDETVKASEKSATMLGVIMADMKDSTKKMFPTLSAFRKSLASNVHPALKVAYDVAKETKDYFSDAGKRADSQNKELNAKQALEAEKLLKENELAAKQDQVLDTQLAAAESQIESNREEVKVKREQPMISRLEAIKQNTQAQAGALAALESVVTGAAPISLTDQKAPRGVEWSETLKQTDLLNRTNQNLVLLVDEIRNQTRLSELAAEREARDRLKALESENQVSDQPQPTLNKSDKEEKHGGIWGTLFGGVLGGGGIMAALKATKVGRAVSKIASIFGSLSKTVSGVAGKLAPLGKMLSLGKTIPIIGQVVAVVTSIYNFFDGFVNAGEKLDKEVVTIKDRIAAGIGSLIGGLVGIVDSIAWLFGADTDWGLKAEQAVTKTLSELGESFDETLNMIVDTALSWKDELVSKAVEMKDNMAQRILTWIDELKEAVFSFLPSMDKLKSGWGSFKNFFTGSEDEKSKQEMERKNNQSTVGQFIISAEDMRILDEKMAVFEAEQLRKQTAAIVNSTTKVDASVTHIHNQPLNSRNTHTSAWAGT